MVRRGRAQRLARSRLSRLLTALLLIAPGAFVPHAVHAQVPGYEEGIIELAAERLPPRTLLVLIDSAGRVLLPLTQILDYVALEYTHTDSTVSVSRLDGGTADVSALTRTIVAGRERVGVAPAQLIAAAGELYLHSDLVGVVLEGDVHVDLSRLTVMLARSPPFPAQQRIISEQRRALLLLLQQQQGERSARDTVSYTSLSGIGVLDWEVASNGLDPTRLTTLRTQAGAALFGGDLNAGLALELGHDAVETVRDATMRYHRVFPQSRRVTQIRLGDILSSGLFARFLRGFEVSNRPFLRNYDLGTVLLSPDLPTGWEFEVLQGSQLLGYSGTGGREPVAVPLRTGATPVQVRMYGPAGQVVESTLLYQTPVSLLPARAVEYAAGAGECEGGCERYAHADARWGYSALVTVGGGVELVEDSIQSRVRPYLLSSFSTGTRATGEVTFMPGALYGGNFAIFPRERSAAHLRMSLSQPGFGPISLLPDTTARWDVELLWDERLPVGRATQSIRAGIAAGGAGSEAQRLRMSAAAGIRRGYLELRYDHDALQQEQDLVSGRATLLLPFRFRERRLLPVINAGLGAGRTGVRIADFGLTIQPRPNMNVNAGVQWNRGLPRPALTLAWSARFGTVQTQIRAVSSPRGGGTSAAIASGSVAMARDGSLTHFPITRVGYGGVHGTVFIDRDGDGRFSPGDETVPNADLVIGGIHTAADDQGRYRLWGLRPYEVAAVAIDSTRVADPGLITLRPSILVRPAPNATRRVDLPLVQTREVIGTVTADVDIATVASLTLEIRDLDSDVVTTTVTFSDGQYYVSRMRPGRYRIAVAASTLDLLRADPNPAFHDFTVSTTGNDIVVELPPIHLRPRPAPQPRL